MRVTYMRFNNVTYMNHTKYVRIVGSNLIWGLYNRSGIVKAHEFALGLKIGLPKSIAFLQRAVVLWSTP